MTGDTHGEGSAEERPHATYRIARAGAVYTALSLARPAANFAVLPILVAALSPDELGLFVLLTPVWWMCQSILTLGANEALARLAASGRPGVGGAILLACVNVTALGALSVLLLWVSSDVLLGVPFSAAVVATIGLGMAQAAAATSTAVLRAQLRVGMAATLLGMSTALSVGPGVLSVLTVSPTAAGYYTAAAVGSGITALFGLVVAVLGANSRFRGSCGVFRESVLLGVFLVPQLLSGLTIDLLARRLVLELANLEALGLYGVAVAAGNLIILLVKAVYQAWAPAYFRMSKERAMPALRSITMRLALTSLVYSIFLSLLVWAAQNFLARAGFSSSEFWIVTLLAAAAGAPTALLSGATNLALRERRTVHASWVITLGSASGLGVAAVLSVLTGWEAVAAAAALGAVISYGIYWIADRGLPLAEYSGGGVVWTVLAVSMFPVIVALLGMISIELAAGTSVAMAVVLAVVALLRRVRLEK